jgi:hypothetical protein
MARRYVAALIQEWYNPRRDLSSNRRRRTIFRNIESTLVLINLNEAEHIATLEKGVADNPNDARAIVALANAYWLSGRGPEAVGELASRAIAADPANRAGWHLWALSESDPRQRVGRWQQVSERFPEDDLALANVADNAASLAGAEQDHDALDLAIATYERLLAKATRREEKEAIDSALRSLRGWRF